MKNKFVAALLSFVIAFGLWLYVVNNISQEMEITLENVSVVLQNESALTQRGLMITGGTEQKMNLTILGNRSEIMKLNSTNVSVVVDLSRIYESGRQSVSYAIYYPADVQTDRISVTADRSRITLTLENKVSKRVPVVVEYTGNVAEGYMPAGEDMVQLSSTHVTVSGPESVVEQMAQAKIQIDMEGRDTSIDEVYEYTLCDSAGEIVEVPNISQVVADVVDGITVQRDIFRVKEVLLDVNVIAGGGATRDTTTLEFSAPSITVWGSDEQLDLLGDVLTLGEIDLSKMTEAQQLRFPVVIPEGVTNLSGLEEVTVKVSFPALATRTFTISNIVPVNVPAGLVAKVVTQQISVTVRGPSQLVNYMRVSDIMVTVDFGDMTIGSTVTKKATVTVSPSYGGVGVLNPGSVTITLEEQPTEPSLTSETGEGETGA